MVSVVAWPQLGQVSVDCSSLGLALLPEQQEEAEATVAWDWTMSLETTRFQMENEAKERLSWLVYNTQVRHAELVEASLLSE